MCVCVGRRSERIVRESHLSNLYLGARRIEARRGDRTLEKWAERRRLRWEFGDVIRSINTVGWLLLCFISGSGYYGPVFNT